MLYRCCPRTITALSIGNGKRSAGLPLIIPVSVQSSFVGLSCGTTPAGRGRAEDPLGKKSLACSGSYLGWSAICCVQEARRRTRRSTAPCTRVEDSSDPIRNKGVPLAVFPAPLRGALSLILNRIQPLWVKTLQERPCFL